MTTLQMLAESVDVLPHDIEVVDALHAGSTNETLTDDYRGTESMPICESCCGGDGCCK